MNTATSGHHTRITSLFKFANAFRKDTKILNNQSNGNKNRNVLYANIEFLQNPDVGRLGENLTDISNDCAKAQEIENASIFKRNTDDMNNYSNNCFPLGYQCFCNLFPCSVKAVNEGVENDKNVLIKTP
ncbi:unnamed protein product [Heterobilharzia americana]|nr:unnamed protein product [Heterobilharzia americana]